MSSQVKKTERQIVSYFELPEEWRKEADSNLDECAEESQYFMPEDDDDPAKHILWDLSECMRVDHEEYDGIIGISNNSAMAVKLSDCGDGATTWML